MILKVIAAIENMTVAEALHLNIIYCDYTYVHKNILTYKSESQQQIVPLIVSPS